MTTHMSEKIKLTDLTPEEITKALELKPFQGKQIFQWIHAKQIFEPQQMTNLSKTLRQVLQDKCIVRQLELIDMQKSVKTGTCKSLFRLSDGETVESVLLRHGKRITVCLSSQVGCAVKCSFCATGQSGYKRNLTPGEIIEQALHLLTGEDLKDRTPNIVFMGMGEPLFNYGATMKSILFLTHEDGLNIGARKITISTAGAVPEIRQFADEKSQVRLSVSIHAANDALRSKLVPLNKKYDLIDVIESCRYYNKHSGRQITLEWTLIKDVNDSEKDAKELIRLMRSIKASINLVPFNPIKDFDYRPPSRERSQAFCKILIDAGIKATLRSERGGDIDAACGQLRRRHLKS